MRNFPPVRPSILDAVASAVMTTSATETIRPITSLNMKLLLLLTAAPFFALTSSAWTTISRTPAPVRGRLLDVRKRHHSRFISATSANSDNGVKQEPWKISGEEQIKTAAVSVGAREDQVSIEWKGERIIVTINGTVNITSSSLFADDGDAVYDDDSEIEYDDDGFDYDDNLDFDREENAGDMDYLTVIARAINAALDEQAGSMGYDIALHHEIEVTTPKASDVLSGDVMFDAYKGFDVIVETADQKNGKRKVVEGKLVERDDQVTKVNVKGRIRKIKNDMIDCVRLPKAKKEKGAR